MWHCMSTIFKDNKVGIVKNTEITSCLIHVSIHPKIFSPLKDTLHSSGNIIKLYTNQLHALYQFLLSSVLPVLSPSYHHSSPIYWNSLLTNLSKTTLALLWSLTHLAYRLTFSKNIFELSAICLEHTLSFHHSSNKDLQGSACSPHGPFLQLSVLSITQLLHSPYTLGSHLKTRGFFSCCSHCLEPSFLPSLSSANSYISFKGAFPALLPAPQRQVRSPMRHSELKPLLPLNFPLLPITPWQEHATNRWIWVLLYI